eukprot:gb/GFBE01039018.1/.p1 GENE.gb/GFBE01039018.1/~~gb/GFBE01039018.1/.p1  ORF type:complete len:714 (+),score=84.41 gb/GFBE01039018.1/:1-2142(+)
MLSGRSPSRPVQPQGAWQVRPDMQPRAAPRARVPFLRSIRDEFRACGGSEESPICAADLVRHWYSLAEDERRLSGADPLDSQERSAIALRAAQAVNGMGLRHSGTVHMDEWVHDRLLAASELPTPALAAQINSALQWELQRQPTLLAEVQWLLEVADSSHGGLLTLDDVRQAYSAGLWRFAAGPEGLQVLSDSELSSSDPARLARDLIVSADLDGRRGRLSYAELLAFCLGRQKQVVSLALYDLSDGLARRITPYIFGQQLDGLWHTSVVAFGIEYFFGGDICRAVPGQTKFGKPTKLMPLGITLRTPTELESFLGRGLKADFSRDTYDVLHKNCNHFSDRVSLYLTGRRIPEEVLRMPECAANAPAMLRPLLNHWLSGAEARARTGPSSKEGHEVRPPPLSRQPHAAVDQKPLTSGQVVGVLPSLGQVAQTMVGQVWKATKGAKGPQLPPAPQDKVWVRFYEPPSMHHRGKMRTELVDLARIQTAQPFTGQSYDAALVALSSPPAPRTPPSSVGAALDELVSAGHEARHAEAVLALVGGSVKHAASVLHFQSRARTVLGDVTVKSENFAEGRQESVGYSSLGVPTIHVQQLAKAHGEGASATPARGWAVPPSDLLSGSRRRMPEPVQSPTHSLAAPPAEIRHQTPGPSRQLHSAGGSGSLTPVASGLFSFPFGATSPTGSGYPSSPRAVPGQQQLQRARRLTAAGLGGLGGA